MSMISLQADPVKTYSFDELIDSAYSHSGAVKNSTLILEQSYNRTNEIRSSFFPRLTLNGSTGRYFRSYDRFSREPMVSYTEKYVRENSSGYSSGTASDFSLAKLIDESVNGYSSAPKERYLELGLSAVQPILNSGTTISDYKMSKVESSILVCHWQEIHMNIKTDMAKRIYAFLRAKTRADLMKEHVLFAEQLHGVVRAGFKAGENLAIDTLSSYLDLLKAQEDLFEMNQELRLEELSVKEAAGIDTLDSLKISGDFKPVDYAVGYDSAEQRLIATNKQITKQRGEITLSELAVQRARKAYLPQISIGADVMRLSHFNSSEYFSLDPERRVHLDLTYNLTTSGQRWFALASARQQKEIEENHLQDLIREQTMKLKRTWQEWEIYKVRLERLKTALEIAEKERGIARKQYESGTLPLIKLNEIQQKLTLLKNSYVDLVYRHNCTVIEIRLLTADYLYN